MSDEIRPRDKIESPCIRVCVIHPVEGLCTGCLRTLDEIVAWSQMTPEARRTVMAGLEARRPRLRRTRGGRSDPVPGGNG